MPEKAIFTIRIFAIFFKDSFFVSIKIKNKTKGKNTENSGILKAGLNV